MGGKGSPSRTLCFCDCGHGDRFAASCIVTIVTTLCSISVVAARCGSNPPGSPPFSAAWDVAGVVAR
eukprot:9026067-Lingulodinium_polyedra.AAC.1